MWTDPLPKLIPLSPASCVLYSRSLLKARAKKTEPTRKVFFRCKTQLTEIIHALCAFSFITLSPISSCKRFLTDPYGDWCVKTLRNLWIPSPTDSLKFSHINPKPFYNLLGGGPPPKKGLICRQRRACSHLLLPWIPLPVTISNHPSFHCMCMLN